MNELVSLKGNNVFTNSLVIAEGTGNKHKNVKELILKYENDFMDFGTLSVLNGESTGGRPEQYYLLNEEQATFVMTLLRNSKNVVGFKKELVKQFYEMRRFILERQSIAWQLTRLESKTNRRMETDEIKQFVQYAFDSGSKSAEKYYMNFTKLANKAVGIEPKSRDVATVSQLNNLILIEHIIGQVVVDGVKQELYYKDVFQNCKKRIEQFREIAFLQMAG